MSSRTYVKRQRPVSYGSQGRSRAAAAVAANYRASARARSAVASSVPAKYMRAAVQAQKKKDAGYVDLAGAGYNCDTTGSIALIATIAQGAGTSQRIGKKAIYKSLQIRGHVANNSTAITNDVAVLIVYDRDPTGALPNVTDILTSSTHYGFLNDINSDRFRIVRRVTYSLSGNTATPATGNEIKDMDEYIDLKGAPVQFKAAATGAIGDIAVGALYVVTVGSTVAGSAAASANLAFRTRFVDVDG